MIETLKRHPLIGAILLIVAIVGGLSGFVDDVGKLWKKITDDRIAVDTPTTYQRKQLLQLVADVPVEWIINRGHIESWLYVVPPNVDQKSLDFGKAETGGGSFPYIFEHYDKLSDVEYDQYLQPEDQGLDDFESISIMAEVFLGEGGFAERYRYRTKEYYVEKVSFVNYYHGEFEEPYLLELQCVVPIAAEDRFKSACSRIIGSSTIQE